MKFLVLLLLASVAMQAMEKPYIMHHSAAPVKLGRYVYCPHACLRMGQRQINHKQVEEAIHKGDRYYTLEGRQLCFLAPQKLGVIFDQNKETVVTVLNMNKKRLTKWLEKRNNATPEEKKAAYARKKKTDAYVESEQLLIKHLNLDDED